MKALIIILIIFNGIFSLPAQSYYVLPSRASSVQVEVAICGRRSILGHMRGVNVGLDLNNRWNFSYMSMSMSNNEQSENSVSGNKYQGVEVSYAINPQNQLQVALSAQAGFYNENYFAIHPVLQFQYAPAPNYFVALGVGKSDGFPLFNIELGAVIFKRKY